jgi:regulation of enolase protein 1 (concanavalin A-like superfamily)
MRLAALVVLALIQQPPKTIFEDRFQGKLADGWSWVREDAPSRVVGDGVLRLRSLPGSFWGKAADAKNVLVRRVPRSGIGLSLGIEVDVAFKPETPSEQAGVMLRVSDDHYVKLVVQNVEGARKLALAFETPKGAEPIAAFDLKAPSSRLRLSWEGNKIVAESKPEGTKDWGILTYTDNPFKDEALELQAGLFVHGAPADVERWAEFRDFKVLFDE